MRLFMRSLPVLAALERRILGVAYCAALLFSCYGRATAASYSVNVYMPDAVLQAEFIASTTNQYIGTLTKSPFFPNTYSFTATKKNPGYTPPAVSSPIPTATAFGECISYGFGWGMDEERRQDQSLIWGLHRRDAVNKTCGGVAVSSNSVSISTTSCQTYCMEPYYVIQSTITERWGIIFNSTGGVVNP